MNRFLSFSGSHRQCTLQTNKNTSQSHLKVENMPLKFTTLDSGEIYSMLAELYGNLPKSKVYQIIDDLPKRDRNLLNDYLIWVSEKRRFPETSQRYFAKILRRNESDLSYWKKQAPKIVENVVNMTLGKIKLNRSFSPSNFEKIHFIKKSLNELSASIGKERLYRIIGCYKQESQAIKYFSFLEKFDGPEFSAIKKEYGDHLVASWLRGKIPNPVRVLLRIHGKKYHLVKPVALARLLGWVMGDGGLNENLGKFFICGKQKDLEKIRGFIRQNFPLLGAAKIIENSGGGQITKVNGEVKYFESGDSWELYIHDRAFSSVVYAYGAPKGKKVLSKFNVPCWIKNGEITIKKAFINSLFECESQTHNVIFNVKKNKTEILPVYFGMNKWVDYQESLVEFLNELRELLIGFNIEVSGVEKPRPSCLRKDGKITCSARFGVSTSMVNVIKFSKAIDYSFNEEKKLGLARAIIEAKNKISAAQSRVDLYKHALQLYASGSCISDISKCLGISYSTAEQWVKTKKHLPRFIDNNIGKLLDA